MMQRFKPTADDLIRLTPAVGAIPDWTAIWGLSPDFAALDACPQDPVHHAEGNAGVHTRMVAEALIALPQWKALSASDRALMFWTACLHDIGKPTTTQHGDDGSITSRGHSRLGASMAREFLRGCGVDFTWREALCGLIAHHQLPFWLIERPDPNRMAIETALNCRPDLLCLHAKADALGRICADQQSVLENVELAAEVFAEVGCSNGPFPFANAESRLGYMENEGRDPHYAAHQDHRCTAYVMSALPGSGKDTWISQNLPDIPMVSLDYLREQSGTSATENQGRIIHLAFQKARGYMRDGQDFVWNSTNLTRQTRSKILRLIRDYGVRSHIVYVEVSPDQLAVQNESREDMVPPSVIAKMARKLEPPTLAEAHDVTFVVPKAPCP